MHFPFPALFMSCSIFHGFNSTSMLVTHHFIFQPMFSPYASYISMPWSMEVSGASNRIPSKMAGILSYLVSALPSHRPHLSLSENCSPYLTPSRNGGIQVLAHCSLCFGELHAVKTPVLLTPTQSLPQPSHSLNFSCLASGQHHTW